MNPNTNLEGKNNNWNGAKLNLSCVLFKGEADNQEEHLTWRGGKEMRSGSDTKHHFINQIGQSKWMECLISLLIGLPVPILAHLLSNKKYVVARICTIQEMKCTFKLWLNHLKTWTTVTVMPNQHTQLSEMMSFPYYNCPEQLISLVLHMYFIYLLNVFQYAWICV